MTIGAIDDSGQTDGSPIVPGIEVRVSTTGSSAVDASGRVGVVWREGAFRGAGSIMFVALDMTGTIVQGPLAVIASDNVELIDP